MLSRQIDIGRMRQGARRPSADNWFLGANFRRQVESKRE